MAATTFSIDTPLYIAGVVGTRGIAGNWEWWSFGIAHVVMIYVFSRLWRRSEIVTDAELTELRYGGHMGAWLRGIKAFLFAVPINCIGIGYAMLAMVKVITALQLWESLGFEPGDNTKLWSVIGVSLFVLVYAGLSGLWGVVATDFFSVLFGAVGGDRGGGGGPDQNWRHGHPGGADQYPVWQRYVGADSPTVGGWRRLPLERNGGHFGEYLSGLHRFAVVGLSPQ